jgi:hypothetical protein
VRFSRRSGPPVETEIVASVEAVEIPVIIEAKRRVARGEYRAAILEAFPTAVKDLERALPQPFPPGWTIEEILARGIPAKHRRLGEYLAELHGMYAPLRFGGATGPVNPTRIVDLLQGFYSDRLLWQLYLQPKQPPAAGPTNGGASVSSLPDARPAES